MDLPILDELDTEILKHRDAHFGGNFQVMIDYYEQEGIGVVPDFDIDRIVELHELQEKLGENLSLKILTQPMLEEVGRVKELYLKLREMYDHGEALLPDLILTEKEEPLEEIKAILAAGEKMVEPLLYLINSPNFYNPLYPGYGRTPAFAAICLAELKEEKAIPHIFHALGGVNLDVEEALLATLPVFGEPAKTFLLQRLTHMPVSKENLNAAIALAFFPPSDAVAKTALSLLSQDACLFDETFAPYLVCLAEGLQSEADRIAFKKLPFPKDLRMDAKAISDAWVDG